MLPSTQSPSSPTPPAPQQPYTRLHISPIDEATLSVAIPAALQPLIANLSFHTIETFPDASYAFLDLPTEHAIKLKQRLHGSILKGKKMKVEEARQAKKRSKPELGGEEAWEDVDAKKQSTTGSKRSKRSEPQLDVMEGIELPKGRRVKRGWTESGTVVKNKKQKKSKEPKVVAEDSKALFRAELPARAVKSSGKDKDKKSQKSKAVKEVKEFSNTTKFPSFLRENKTSGKKRASKYIDGQGWVDENGDIVEAARVSNRAAKSKSESQDETVEQEDLQQSPDSESSDQASISEQEPDGKTAAKPVQAPEATTETTTAPETNTQSTLASKSPEAKPVHPLEALFKRPALRSTPSYNGSSAPTPKASNRPAPIKTSFSFFSNDDDADEGTGETGGLSTMPPQTPFTLRDMEHRNIRSAAPTPDTAAIGKRFFAPWGGRDTSVDDEDDDEKEEKSEEPPEADVVESKEEPEPDDEPEQEQQGNGEEKQGEFEKHFWANRGDYNRAWKARKREARKEARQSENRKRRRV